MNRSLYGGAVALLLVLASIPATAGPLAAQVTVVDEACTSLGPLSAACAPAVGILAEADAQCDEGGSLADLCGGAGPGAPDCETDPEPTGTGLDAVICSEGTPGAPDCETDPEPTGTEADAIICGDGPSTDPCPDAGALPVVGPEICPGEEPVALSAEAGGPYSGDEGTAIAISGSGAGGVAPYSCVWSATGAVFGNANSCSTTVTFATEGARTLNLQVTDADSTVATDTASVDVADVPVEPECPAGDEDSTTACVDVTAAPEFTVAVDDGGDGLNFQTANNGATSESESLSVTFTNGDAGSLDITLGTFVDGAEDFDAQNAQVCVVATESTPIADGTDCASFTDGDATLTFTTPVTGEVLIKFEITVPADTVPGSYQAPVDVVGNEAVL